MSCVIDTRGDCRLQNGLLSCPCSLYVGLACSDHPFSDGVSSNDLEYMDRLNNVNSYFIL